MDYHKEYDEIIAKAWADPAFKRRLLDNPVAVAKEHGIPVPSNMKIRIVENTDDVVHVVLPVKPPEGLLTDEQLDSISGGFSAPTGTSKTANRCVC